MKITIHRGVGQIGGNIVEVAANDQKTKIILDCGRNLPPLDDPNAPEDNIEIKGLTSGISEFDAVFVTHHHADHCGLLGRVNNDIPIYMSGVTNAVLGVVADFIDARPLRGVETVEQGDEIDLRGMRILPIKVNHSAKGALMYLVEADGQRLLYTGDFSDVDEEDFIALGSVSAMLCEGTNVEVLNDDTEDEVLTKTEKIMNETNKTAGEVFVLCSTTNINRIEAIDLACKNSKRVMAIDPFLNAILQKVGYEMTCDMRQFLPRGIKRGDKPRMDKYVTYKHIVPARELAATKNLTYMVRQSMGDFLIRLGGEKSGLRFEGKTPSEFQDFRREVTERKPFSESKLVYSIWRGYEKTVYTGNFLKLCRDLGLGVEYLHVSGHVYRKMLGETINRISPQTLIPIHTESADTFTKLYRNVRLLDNGETWSIE